MIRAIVYTSNTGHTKRYAEMLGERLDLPVYALSTGRVKQGESVIYLGWLMAGRVMGYRKASRRYKICALCGVGMRPAGSQVSDMRAVNSIPRRMPVFNVRGGLDKAKLGGIRKLAIKLMERIADKELSGKTERTEREDEILDILKNGGDRVCASDLDELAAWYEKYSFRPEGEDQTANEE